MKKLLIFLAALVVLVLLMKVTVPSPDKHREVATEQLTVYVEDNISDFGEIAEYLDEFGIDKKQAIKFLVDNMLYLDDYFVCNVGKFEYDGEVYPLTLGLFGYVFVLTDYVDEMQAINEKYELGYQ